MKKLTDIPKESGVYCIQNIINNKIYIGSSKNLLRRFHGHNSFRSNYNVIKAFKKYGKENFTFSVIKLTADYLLWENLFLRLLKPEYNIATMIGEENQPNIGKKFNQTWIDNLPKCKGHSLETKEKLLILNKENSCKISFEKNNENLNFSSWVEAGKHFNVKTNPAACFTKTKIKENNYQWKKWNITRLTKQKKKVKLKTEDKEYIFNSSYECDKFMNLWRGATSNAIKNNKGVIHSCKVEYI